MAILAIDAYEQEVIEWAQNFEESSGMEIEQAQFNGEVYEIIIINVLATNIKSIIQNQIVESLKP